VVSNFGSKEEGEVDNAEKDFRLAFRSFSVIMTSNEGKSDDGDKFCCCCCCCCFKDFLRLCCCCCCCCPRFEEDMDDDDVFVFDMPQIRQLMFSSL